jgi:hypothetical protein
MITRNIAYLLSTFPRIHCDYRLIWYFLKYLLAFAAEKLPPTRPLTD